MCALVSWRRVGEREREVAYERVEIFLSWVCPAGPSEKRVCVCVEYSSIGAMEWCICRWTCALNDSKIKTSILSMPFKVASAMR